MSIKQKIKYSDEFLYTLIRNIYLARRKIYLPAPFIIWRPVWILFKLIRIIFYWIYSFLWVTPIYKGLFTSFGKEFKAGSYLPYMLGKGKIFVGDKVTFFGKIDFIFGNIRDKIPEIRIGNNTVIGHNVLFDIADTLIIGDNCLIAEGVSFHDSHGHHIDPSLRLKKVPIDTKQLRSITIGNNVWIADGAFISPGTIIGDNCIISAKTVVRRNIPANHVVYPGPNKIARLRNTSSFL